MTLETFAIFLHDYGPYAMSSVFAGLYWLERKDRQGTQARYEGHLQRAPREMREHAAAQTTLQSAALERLERAITGKQSS